MRYVKLIVVILVLCIIGAMFLNEYAYRSYDTKDSGEARFLSFRNILGQSNDTLPQLANEETYGELIHIMSQTTANVIEKFGTPDRIDPSAYGYEWWIYKDKEAYIQIGVEDGIVTTIYATGDAVSLHPFSIGADYEEISAMFPFEKEITFESSWKKYVFLLNEDDLKVKPMIKLTDDLYVVNYFDQFTNKLSSIRLMSIDVLLKQRLYDMEYRGTLASGVELSRTEWEAIEAGMEKQILDITNMYRKRHQLQTLQSDELVGNVAFLHSKDMADRNYFSHVTPEGKTVGDRLQAKEIFYRVSAENIAFNLSDGPDVSEGWLNSEDHRQAVLEPTFTILGVGVYEKYYTQNFIFK